MARLSSKARREANLLIDHYIAKGRKEASDRLTRAIRDALIRADAQSPKDRTFPAVYRDLADLGFRWFKIHRYWFAVESTRQGNIIAHVIYEQADFLSRLRDDLDR